MAKECGTTDKGTTLDGMRKALKNHQVDAHGFALNRTDFRKLPAPAIVLLEDHYVVLDHVDNKSLFAYDPMRKSIQRFPLPEAGGSPGSEIPVLSLSMLTLNAD